MGSRTGSKKKVPPSQRRHHHADQAAVGRPENVGDGLVDVVEGDRGLAADPPPRLGAEVHQPAVEGQVRGADDRGITAASTVHRLAVAVDDLGDHALGLQVRNPSTGVPLPVLADGGVDEPVRRPLHHAEPVVEVIAKRRIEVLPVRRSRRLHVTVHRDDRCSSHVRHSILPLADRRGRSAAAVPQRPFRRSALCWSR
jgi:hypothetical protein